MATIVAYRDDEVPLNAYPERIVSPTRGRACCVAGMRALGAPWQEGRVTLEYRRCVVCGFTVRRIVAVTADPGVLASVRAAFRPLFAAPGAAAGRPPSPVELTAT